MLRTSFFNVLHTEAYGNFSHLISLRHFGIFHNRNLLQNNYKLTLNVNELVRICSL